MYYYCIVFFSFISKEIAAQNRCYSCASANMKVNFLNKNRGPQRRMSLPKVFDNNCDIDTWIIKERAAVDCPGQCFKWQEIVNNSGVFSYMTIRDCYTRMYDITSPQTIQPPSISSCTNRERPLECLADTTLLDSFCWCQGDLCNISSRLSPTYFINILLFFYTIFIFLKRIEK